MRVAIKWNDVVVGPEGTVLGHEAGDTLVRRLVRIFDHPVVVGSTVRRCQDFDVSPLEFIDPAATVVINMDVVDSPQVYSVLARTGGGPHVMNFVWRPVRTESAGVETAAFALSCALFPTFADAERTASEVREVVQRWTVPQLAEKMKLGWVNLGFRLEHVQEHRPSSPPVVLYPAIYLSRTKHPEVFLRVVERVRKSIPLRISMSLQESHLVSEQAMRISQRDWAWVGPLTATRASYWEGLAHTTAFLATAEEESYGLTYVEALGAGVIGILPDREWARILVPQGYPFLYRTEDEAATLLTRALREPEACARELDECAGGSFSSWIAAHHSDDAFDKAIVARVHEWFEAQSSTASPTASASSAASSTA